MSIDDEKTALRLCGTRVVIRDFVAADVDEWVRWAGPGAEWRRWDGPYYRADDPEILSERAQALREKITAGDWPQPRTRAAVADREQDRLLGTVSRYWISKETQWAAVGIVLFDPQTWGRGIGTDALRLWCGYHFASDPSIPRLDLRTWSGNERMMRLAERLGFRLEARFRDARVVDGKRYDALGYGILRAEWAAASGR